MPPPPKPTSASRKRPQLSVALPPDTIATLESIAETEHSSVAQVIRALLRQGLNSGSKVDTPVQSTEGTYQHRVESLEHEVIGLHGQIAGLAALVMQHESKLRKGNPSHSQDGQKREEEHHE